MNRFEGVLLRLVPIFQLVGNVVYSALKLLPQRRRVVMLTRRKTSRSIDFDTLRAYLAQHHPEVPVVELIHPIGNKIHYLFLFMEELYYLATSTWVVTDSYQPSISVLPLRKGVRVVQIWHALGAIKQFGRLTIDLPSGATQQTADKMHMHRGYNAICSPSEATAEIFSSAFGVDRGLVRVIGSPRIDYLLTADREAARRRLVRRHRLDPHRPIYLYAPTFRDNRPVPIERLTAAFADSKAQLIVHMHSRDADSMPETPGVAYSRVSEALTLLPGVDGVITDYSAIIFETGILSIPVALWAFDLDEYRQSPGFALDYDNELSEIITPDPKQTVALLDSRHSVDSPQFREFMDMYIETADTDNCGRLTALLGISRV